MLSPLSVQSKPQPVAFQGNQSKNMIEKLSKTKVATNVRNVSPFAIGGAAFIVLLGAWLAHFTAQKGEPASFNPIKTVNNNPVGIQMQPADIAQNINVFA